MTHLASLVKVPETLPVSDPDKPPWIWRPAEAPFVNSEVKRYWDRSMGRWRASIRGEHLVQMLYSRYLMCVHLREILPKEVHVDHINGDRTDDRIENLQVLSLKQHALKSSQESRDSVEWLEFRCPSCSAVFSRPQRDIRSKTRVNPRYTPCCSRSCGAKLGNLRHSGLKGDNTVISDIKRLRGDGRSSYYIARELGISRNTVMKYW